MEFNHGARVRHKYCVDDAGQPIEGAIFVYPPVGGAPGGVEVRWDDMFVSSELALVGSELDLI